MRIRARAAGITSKMHCSPREPSIRVPRPSLPEMLRLSWSIATDSKNYRSRIRLPHLSVRCSCMAPRGASDMLSFARRMVSSATSVRRLHRVDRWWAFTQNCNLVTRGQTIRAVHSCGWQRQELVIVRSAFAQVFHTSPVLWTFPGRFCFACANFARVQATTSRFRANAPGLRDRPARLWQNVVASLTPLPASDAPE